MPEPPRQIPYATWPGALAVLCFVIALVGGFVMWDSRVPGNRALPVGQTVEAGHGTRLLPAEGWQMNLPSSRAGTSLALFKDGSSFYVSTAPWLGGPEGPMARQRRLLERAQGLRIDGDEQAFITPWGLQGRTFAYYGAATVGRHWQIVDTHHKVVVQVDFHAAPSDAALHLAEARAMVDSMDLEAPP